AQAPAVLGGQLSRMRTFPFLRCTSPPVIATPANFGIPVPLSATCCGLPGALSAIRSAAVRRPAAIGLKRTPIEQLAPRSRDAPEHVSLALAKAPGLLPPSVVAVGERARSPTFVTVTVLGALVNPIRSLPNASVVGLNRAIAGRCS